MYPLTLPTYIHPQNELNLVVQKWVTKMRNSNSRRKTILSRIMDPITKSTC
ncbi:hypothetical protein AALP_AA4G155600 [Arabis alpina]|uniref:Uncharacterized protein n=1 Tax=Arabis alpina TaxID=50452 RepID=A0A087H3H8_ARAAL|nr:hypothetical protein AALP_AA4G155600 [Arabis alpina]